MIYYYQWYVIITPHCDCAQIIFFPPLLLTEPGTRACFIYLILIFFLCTCVTTVTFAGVVLFAVLWRSETLYKTSTTTVMRVRLNWFLTSWLFRWIDFHQHWTTLVHELINWHRSCFIIKLMNKDKRVHAYMVKPNSYTINQYPFVISI